MPDIRDMLRAGPLIADGAFGTYFQQLTGLDAMRAETANLDNPSLVASIHAEYLDAGARLLRANTFAAHTLNPALPEGRSDDALKAGFALAAEAAARRGAIAAASVGPLPATAGEGREIPCREREDAMLRMLATLYEAGARHFVFETWPDTPLPEKGARYLRGLDPDVFILCQFTVLPDGRTRLGTPLHELWSAALRIPCDAVGLNCGSGPAHMLGLMESLPRPFGRPASALPNAGYPGSEGGRTRYWASADYFAEAAARMKALGILLIGGCCGTTPRHIAAISAALGRPSPAVPRLRIARPRAAVRPEAVSPLSKPVAVELEPPADGRAGPVIRAAARLREAGASLVTIPDSPLGRSRMNSVMLAALVVREAGIAAMPHLTCRDRNLIALQSDLAGAWASGVRHLLLVTGDPVSAGSRDGIKGVFNTNSYGLLSLARELNETVFRDDPMVLAAACNPHAASLRAETDRMRRKAREGARRFFSQPLFNGAAVSRLEALGRPEGCLVFAGLMPPVSRRNALFLRNEVPGLDVPDELVGLFDPGMDREAAEEASAAYTASIGSKSLRFADGLYIVTPFGRTGLIGKIISRLREREAEAAP